ncbi:unnamed protein product [Sphagnum tenellum]
MGEAVLGDVLRKQNKADGWIVASCGTGDHESGNTVYPRAVRALQRHGIDNFQHTARQIQKSDFDKYDLILGFDDKNIKEIQRMKPNRVKPTFVSSIRSTRSVQNKPVEDPWYPDSDQAFG